MVNDAWTGRPHSSSEDGTGGQALAGPREARLRHAEAPGFVHRAWALLFRAARDLNAARRAITDKGVETGGASMWSLLRKAVADAYGRVAGKEVYKPLVADDIKEFGDEYVGKKPPTVALLPNLPARIAETFANRSRMIRKLSPEVGLF